jgi:cobalt transporter subunit CbtA
MIFSRIIYSAILIGIVTGVVLSCLQVINLNPIIVAAESFEVDAGGAGSAAGDHSGDSHEHSHDEWAPADGLERTAYTFLANVLASTGFAAILLAMMAQFWLARERNISWSQGLLWGLAGYLAVFVAPAFGLPPEIPGAVAAPVEHRQLWWALTVLSVSIGLGLLAFAATKFKALGLLLLALPYVIGAPHNQGPMFQHADPAALAALTELHQRFVVISGITNLVFWLLLGIACRLAFNRWFRPIPVSDDYARA